MHSVVLTVQHICPKSTGMQLAHGPRFIQCAERLNAQHPTQMRLIEASRVPIRTVTQCRGCVNLIRHNPRLRRKWDERRRQRGISGACGLKERGNRSKKMAQEMGNRSKKWPKEMDNRQAACGAAPRASSAALKSSGCSGGHRCGSGAAARCKALASAGRHPPAEVAAGLETRPSRGLHTVPPACDRPARSR